MERLLGEILTFYSYKGGVGRSMALANIACLLANRQSNNEKVLMIDWDLEAPGLHQFFHGKFIGTGDVPTDLPIGQLGLIDLFYEIRKRLETKELEDEVSDVFFDELNIPKYLAKLTIPSLLLMPAGNFEDDLYSNRVNEFNWAEFFNKYPLVISRFAQYLRKKYKYILVDSRTGYTDISGICTSIMPEKLVVVFTPNRQSLVGVVEVIRRATTYRKQSDDLRPLMIFPLASRIENAESKLQKEWRFGKTNALANGYQERLENAFKDAYQLQSCDLTRYFDEVQLQYVPRYSFGEEIAVLSERTEDRLSLARSFESFAERIVSTINPWEETLDTFTSVSTSKETSTRPTVDISRRISPRVISMLAGLVILVLAIVLGLPFIQNVLIPKLTNITLTGTLVGQIVLTVILWLILGAGYDIVKSLLQIFSNVLYSPFTELTKRLKASRMSIDASFNSKTYSAREKSNPLLNLFADAQVGIRNVIERLLYGARNMFDQVSSRYLDLPKGLSGDEYDTPRRNPYQGQRITGALIEFIALLFFLYADAAQGAYTYNLLFPSGAIPVFLNNITIPLVVSSAGTALILGIFIGDLLGLTHLSDWGKLEGKARGIVSVIVVSNLILAIGLSTLIALYRVDVLSNSTTTSVFENLALYAQSLIVIPLLITTSLLLRGAFGIFVVVGIVLYLLSGLLYVFSGLIEILKRTLDILVFIIIYFIYFISILLELLIIIISYLSRGLISLLIAVLGLVFFIPYFVARIIFRRYTGKDLIDFVSITSSDEEEI
jgi:cellulose biosynthesis protein BcsQ